MKTLKILILAIFPLLFFACSEDAMDDVNKARNDALDMSAQNMLADVILKSAFETTGTDIAWYATVYIEHSAGTWAQSSDADKRVGQTAATLFNNNWNSLYDVLMICDDMIKKTEPDGAEAGNQFARGVAKLLTAYNLAVATDMWGEVPWTEALKGAEIMQPKYDNQSTLYPKIQQYLDDAITSFNAATNISRVGDYIYAGNKAAWIKAAYSLKARYYMRLSQKDASAASISALDALAKGFKSNADNFIFAVYTKAAAGENPWYQFLNDRTHLSASKTLFDIMYTRNDPRIAAYFTMIGDTFNPAPSGQAVDNQGGVYSTSLLTDNLEGATAATPLMTYHELKFIEAEARFRTSDAAWDEALKDAIEANFAFHGVTGDSAYYADEVAPRLTAGNELNEILMQKYIAFYEFEAIEAYNDYRRVPAFLTLNNPNNATAGFVWRFPYALSEEQSNSANVPDIDVFTDKVWWAGGTELAQ